MKTRLLFLLYLIISFAEITLVAQGNDALRMFTKPLIIPILAAIYLTSTNKRVSFFKDAILLGLGFSWIGDILLQMKGRFVPGLVSFLVAHIFYIRFFTTTSSTEKSFFKLRPVMLLGVMAYLIELMYLLWPFLGDMKIPVLLYGITISTMLSAALWQYQKLENKTAVFFILGAFFFVVSDSILAINKFRNAFETAGILIMTTYIVAQLLIVEGAIRYRNQTA